MDVSTGASKSNHRMLGEKTGGLFVLKSARTPSGVSWFTDCLTLHLGTEQRFHRLQH